MDIIIIGGGRWARVLSKELIRIVPLDVSICMCSPRNSSYLLKWAIKTGLSARVDIVNSLPSMLPSSNTVVLVANAAKDHVKSVEWAIKLGSKLVMVEKPISLSHIATKKIVDKALLSNVIFAPSNVFSFDNTIENYIQRIKKKAKLNSVFILWEDPVFEHRHNEIKYYDATLPVFADWLPHIVAIIWDIIPSRNLIIKRVNILKGGATVKVKLKSREINLDIVMVRNGKKRQRVMEVLADEKKLKLDFSDRSGIIYEEGETIIVNPDPKERGPLSKMLIEFLKSANKEKLDSRFNTEIGLVANRLIDEIMPLYKTDQLNWLSSKLVKCPSVDDEIKYAITELFNYKEEPPKQVIDREVQKLKKVYLKK